MDYRRTVHACYLSYVSHAVINNLPPLLFALLARIYGLNLERLGRLVLFNFVTHLIVDALAIKLADRVGYRRCLVLAHFMAALGLVLFGALPLALPAERIYTGLCAAVVVFSVGGGLIQTLPSPIINQISGHLGAGSMTLLHSFYGWGQMLTVICTTAALPFLPESLWYVLPLAWSAVPLVTMACFATAPMAEPRTSEKPSQPLGELARSRRFWLCVGLMACAGATEASMAQWVSLYAEREIGLPKLVGDLLGPCLIALLMASVRTFYGKWENKFPLEKFLTFGAVGTAVCFATAALSHNTALAIAACSLLGVTISLLWPGSVHRGAKQFPGGGTALFGALALGGDIGCSVGPWLLGFIGDRGGLRTGFLAGAAYPMAFFALLMVSKIKKRETSVSEV